MNGLRRRKGLVWIGAALLTATLGLGGCSAQPSLTPAQWAEEYAAAVIPGWERATRMGLLVPLDLTAEIPGSEATITLNEAWYSGRQAYILFTVTAPDGAYVAPAAAQLGDEPGTIAFAQFVAPWVYLDPWGVFTDGGYHSALIFSNLSVPEGAESMTLTLQNWQSVVPQESTGEGAPDTTGLGQVQLTLPWDPKYLEEPEPSVIPLDFNQEWVGRSLALTEMQVRAGRIELTGQLKLNDGESHPAVRGSLKVAGQELPIVEQITSEQGPGSYQITLVTDGPNAWPAPVELHLKGINFNTSGTLEWPVDWAKYGNQPEGTPVLLETSDQQSTRLFESILTTKWAGGGGIIIQQEENKEKAPFVMATLYYSGRGQADQPGWEVASPEGQVDLNPTVKTCPADLEGCDGYMVIPSQDFRGADRLLIRYVDPTAGVVINNSWKLYKG